MGEAKRKEDLVVLVEDEIAEKAIDTFAVFPAPKFLLSAKQFEQCRGLAREIGAKGIFAEHGAFYRLQVDEKEVEGRCYETLSCHATVSVVPDILFRFFPGVEDIWAFVHTEPTRVLGFNQRIFLVTFQGGAPELRRMAKKASGLFIGSSAEKGVLAAFQVITEPYAWNPWKRDCSTAKVV